MSRIDFVKLVASGNDFLVVEPGSGLAAYRLLAKKMCDRIYGAGADGLLILERVGNAYVKMRIFNADGSEAEMCGNGARCAAFYSVKNVKGKPVTPKRVRIKAVAGIIEAEVLRNNVRIKLTDPKGYAPGVAVKVGDRRINVNLLDTGVPHAIIFSEGIEHIDVHYLGRQIRCHNKFSPRGTNVDFVEVLDRNTIKVRTYERGVEAETLACGTGAVASAVVFILQSKVFASRGMVKVITRGGETLKVYFSNNSGVITNTWLEGDVRIVYRGEYDV